MDLESNMIIKNDKLEAFDILKKALTISVTNINFLIFTIITSLPLFCFLVYYEPFVQTSLLEISEMLKPSKGYPVYSLNHFQVSIVSIDSIPTDKPTELNKEFSGGLVQTALLYLIPLHLLELSTILVIVDLASKTFTRQEEEEEPPLTFKEMVYKPFDVTKALGTLVTFVSAVIMSTTSLLGLVWLAAIYYLYYLHTYFIHDVLFILWSWGRFVGLMTMYLGGSAAMNMSVVISVLEGRYGTKAIALAIGYSVGNGWRGVRLMLVSFSWEVGLRLPCIYFGCKGTWNVGILTQIGLFCLGNVVKWVVFTIYFHDCKNREIERKLMMKAKRRAVESG